MKPLTKREFINYLEQLKVPDDTPVICYNSQYEQGYLYNTPESFVQVSGFYVGATGRIELTDDDDCDREAIIIGD